MMSQDEKLSLVAQALKPLGITSEYLLTQVRPNYTVLQALLNYERTPLLQIKTELSGIQMLLNGKIRLTWENEKPKPVFIGVQKELNISSKIRGFEFTEADKNNLKETGHLGRLAEINNTLSFISVDKETNTIVSTSAKNIDVPNQILGKPLSDEDKDKLKKGETLRVFGLVKNGHVFHADLTVDANKKGLAFKALAEKDLELKKTPKLSFQK